MTLNSLTNQGTAQNRKRVGRGMGSGTGKTAGRGHKGQKSRTGGGVRPGFEGGQMPLQMRLPKFGFSSRKNNHLKEVNVKNIDGLDIVTIETLKEKKIISKAVKKVKIFGTFDLTSKVNVEGIKVTKGAKASIEKAGGTIAELKEKTELKKFEKKDKESK
ncbi:50S ribosomal protein L15 [Gammaproteobacteria bacterium]|nr:50S ribosomal protein L15 [Gammaproteobacteria bacterium]MDA9033280.1 50S ribosomal protein L15 [Gammaproteobacteria bacterium]MDA9570903.1 50S ribosomal protein L15 [Gammaproteobacteria bacterium]MDA9575028.1 50S ribosomal protein L15 [Gammaproteobacteria bacterium]MDA9759593.1 50S ribosomal protein L15 [Gammaproteobacteria bacterium]